MKDIKDYSDALASLAEKDSNELFLNSGAEHAIQVLKNIFNFTNKEILLFSGNKKGDVTNSEIYNDAVVNYLEKGNKIKIILEHETNNLADDYLVYQTFKKYQDINSEQVQIRYANDDFFQQMRKYFEDKIVHFCVGDNKRFRLEVSPEDFKAICSFNNDFAKTLSEFFNLEFSKLT